MKGFIPYLLSAAVLTFAPGCTTSQTTKWQKEAEGILNNTLGAPTSDEVAKGLRQALTKGAEKGAGQASQLNGYFNNPKIKIPFPADVQRVETKLRQIGLGSEVDKFILSLNRGAEEAAKSAAPIFINAITSMSIQDAWGILKGNNDAATQYLNRTTSPQLYSAFQPVIKQALQKTQATKYYSDLVNTYNKIPGVQKVNPSLDDYATNKAISGLFVLVAQEELNIRQNPVARTTELLKKVFDEKNRK